MILEFNSENILAHHIFYDSQYLGKYLYKNIKLETPSTSRYGSGHMSLEIIFLS